MQTIVGGEYAVAKNCPVGEIKDAFRYLFGKWLARSSRELRPAPSFIVLLDAQDEIMHTKRRVDIYVPLQPKRPLNKAKQMNIEVQTLEPKRVAYMRHVGPYNGASRVWADFITRLKKDGGCLARIRCSSAYLDNPKVTPPEKLRYDACDGG